MSGDNHTLKRLLRNLPGLRIAPKDLFITDNDRLLVISRITNIHPAERPDAVLDQATLHDKLLELMENCHTERDAMWARSRMEPRFWSRVRVSTSWAKRVSEATLRTLALGLTQGAWAHFKNPRRNRSGEPQPYCKLAIAALRFGSDIWTYEGHLKQPASGLEMDFSEWRGQVYLDNGKRLIGLDRRPITQPVFPIKGYDRAIDACSGGLSEEYDLTQDEPDEIKALQRV